MADVDTLIPAAPDTRLNVADRLAEFARRIPDVTAVACPRRWSPSYQRVQQGASGAAYATISFAELDADATRIARGLAVWGVPRGTRLALFVRPGIEFATLVFALLRAGMVIILVDPGLGRRNLIRCLSEAEPEGFVAVSIAQAIRQILRHKFSRARWNVTVGRRWFWGGLTLEQLRNRGAESASLLAPCSSLRATSADDPAAIIFTSGSTGSPKGVLYTHRMFDAQVSEIQSAYDIVPGGVDLACFPLFALFNSAMGVTTVLPEMDFSRPATANPKKLLATANDWGVTQAFASPAVWRVLSEHCAKTGERINSLCQVFSCGAAVPADVLRATLACVGEGAKMHTPYGATECLPVSTTEATEVFGETAERTDQGAGVCVGRKFDSIEWRIIRITDARIAELSDAEKLPIGEMGELIVRGPQASPEYATSAEHNAKTKIADGNTFWHRMGDVGYFDDQDRFWYCGRRSQRVETVTGPLYTECVEAIFNTHPSVRRCALVGIGVRKKQVPVLVVELRSSHSDNDWQRELIQFAQAHAGTLSIRHLLAYRSLPVDVRHNAKINRELLAKWAAKRLGDFPPQPPAPSP